MNYANDSQSVFYKHKVLKNLLGVPQSQNNFLNKYLHSIWLFHYVFYTDGKKAMVGKTAGALAQAEVVTLYCVKVSSAIYSL